MGQPVGWSHCRPAASVKEDMLPFCFAASWLLRTPIIVCAPCRRDACSRAARRRGHGSSPRWVAAASNAEQQYLDFAFYSSDAFYMVLQLGCIRVSDASERSKNVRAHWDLPRPRLACLVALTKLRFAHAHTRVQHARYARCVPALACESRS